MSRAEYIIWRVEAKEQVQEEHPQWTTQMVNKYVDDVEAILKQKGLMVVD